MIYGHYAKEYANTSKSKFCIMSESEAIINYMIEEQNHYTNLLLNETYIDDKERIVMEAKIEAIREAFSGVIITAVITILGVLSALLVKFLSMLKQGSSKVKDNAKKVADNIKKEGQKETSNTKDNNDNSNSKGNSIHSPEGTKTGNSNDKDNKNSKTIEKEYKTQVRKLSTEVSNSFENGKIDIQSDWFKIMKSKLEEDFRPLSQSDKFHGFCLFDFTSIVKVNAIKKFNDDVRVAATDRDISNIDPNRVNNTGHNLGIVGANGDTKTNNSVDLYNAIVDNGYSLLDETIVSQNQNSTNAGNILVEFYNQKSNDTIEYAATHSNAFIDSGINETTMKVIKKMNDDISQLRKTLDRLKSVNFNANDISGSKVYTDNITDQDKLDIALQKQADNDYIGASNKQDFINNMMYIEQNACKIFTSFTQTWSELETYRLKYVNDFNKVFNTHVSKAIKESVYREFKMKYSDSFNKKDPYPEYN